MAHPDIAADDSGYLLSFTLTGLPDGRLHVSLLDVGQGDAILVQQGSQQVLVDGGPSPQAVALELGRKMPFWDRSVELMVLTHPHADRITGLVTVLQRYRVARVLHPDLEYDSNIHKAWFNLIEEERVPCQVAQAGQQVKLGVG
jgi:competence protein ComEC